MFKQVMISFLMLASAAAHAYPLTTQMTCSQVRRIVQKERAVVLYSGNGISGRYVSSAWSCEINQEIVRAWVPTADQAQCLAGYYCRDIINGG